ncbi:hypothetical protein [Staphylococcus marylandisciuri]|uniref:hypothetical protein n=1 Tax=Staphylococcus marylandisciuri TaxID=2981529 RepID=UPI0021D3CC72|nr:hypothetical protein [Staphylococcus marylandisciuri]
MTDLKTRLYQAFSIPVILAGAGLRNLFIQIRFLSRSRVVSVSVDHPTFRTLSIGCPEHRNFMCQPHAIE